ncbi:hypothetical protein FHT44_006295 [Mycolicibacterium sp. BK634]|nr:hypothetical protein [Mycolicibacterium sp. BK634]
MLPAFGGERRRGTCLSKVFDHREPERTVALADYAKPLAFVETVGRISYMDVGAYSIDACGKIRE